MKYLILCLSPFMTAALFASELYVRNGISDWTDKESFTKDVAGTTAADSAPAPDDTVFIPDGYTVTVNTTDSRDAVNALDRIRPMGPNATLVISVPANQYWTNACPFVYDGTSRTGATDRYGRLVKRGAGSLELDSKFKYKTSGYILDFNTQLIAEEGTLLLQQKARSETSGKVWYSYVYAVSNGAEFVLAPNPQPYPAMIAGSGTITNRNAASEASITMTGWSEGTTYTPTAEFSGKLGGRIAIGSSARIMFTGTESTMTPNNGRISFINNGGRGPAWKGVGGIRKFGKKGEPSSIGYSSTINLGGSSDNGGIICLATETDGEETTDKMLRIYAYGQSFVDAGAYGGVTFAGDWIRPDLSSNASTFQDGAIQLLGSNMTHACVIKGGMPQSASNGVFHLVKKGAGIWRLADQPTPIANTNRLGVGAITVEEGTFQIDSFARKYDLCALGLGTNTMEIYTGRRDDTKRVDWHIALGASGKEGCLEYTGTNHVNAYSRPLVFKGDARLKNCTEKRVRYLARPPEGAYAKTLTLDGSNALENEISDVTDTAAAPVSVVKEGSGRWVLGGDSSFHGSLSVKEGELVVRKYPQKYSWFKWIIKGCATNSYVASQGNIIQAQVFALYDANTVRQNANLQIVTNAFDDLQPGQACFEANRRYADSNGQRPMSSLFLDKSGTYGMYLEPQNDPFGKSLKLNRENPYTWLPITMRLTNGAPEIVAWDYALYFGLGSNSGRGVAFSTIEGSVDGMHWDNVLGGDKCIYEADMPSGQYRWVSSGTASKNYSNNDAARHTSGGSAYAIPDGFKFAKTTPDAFSVLENVGEVYVAPGARLVADGEGVTISNLTLAATGAVPAVVSNFTFAAEGVLGVTDAPQGNGTSSLPVAFVATTGAANISGWKLEIGGEENSKYQFRASDSGIVMWKRGIVISFR